MSTQAEPTGRKRFPRVTKEDYAFLCATLKEFNATAPRSPERRLLLESAAQKLDRPGHAVRHAL